MGLDMYLTAKRYLSEYDPVEKELKTAIDSVLDTKIGNVTEVTIQVGYWRKANAIHRWFVKNVQDGVDECQQAYVSSEQIQELLAMVMMVLDDHSLAGEILPPGEGFFFGSTELNEYYFQDLEDTKNILQNILNNPDAKDWTFYYQSSW